ncbi:hypothetical protein BG258_14610 [Lysinibacillus fusiformis]|uniref:Uncharacterized protein n=1 Tax=Lysinibacillus fusiformis TaxID=28031 RepID=A0A1E4R9M5_9BACI|nr:hypothetical protein BG258_14610 [Lysinibacillus fusiformis]
MEQRAATPAGKAGKSISWTERMFSVRKQSGSNKAREGARTRPWKASTHSGDQRLYFILKKKDCSKLKIQ